MKPRVTFIYQVFFLIGQYFPGKEHTYQGTLKGKMILKPYLKEYVELFRRRIS